MSALSLVLALALLLALTALAVSLNVLLRYRTHLRGRGLRPWPIPQVAPEAVDPVFQPGPLGPARATEVRFIGNIQVPGGVNDVETWVLCTLAKRARRIFEFGTGTGKTTYLLAVNAPADAKVVTLTLAPDQHEAYRDARGDDTRDRASGLQEAAFSRFYYQGTEAEPRIEQLLGDSKALDETPYRGSMDLVFVDGGHARSYVESDSRKALAMVRPGGLVLWHDYRGPRRARGVFETLNALAAELPLMHIVGTALVAYRAPAADSE